MRGATALLLSLLAFPVLAGEGYGRIDGHGGPVHGVAVQGGAVVSGGFDNAIIFRPPEGEATVIGDGHDAAVKSVRALGGGFYGSTGDDRMAHLWEFHPDHGGWVVRRTSSFAGHTAQVTDIAAQSTDTLGLIATASWDRRIGLWRPADGEGAHVAWLEGHRGPVQAVAFSSDGETLYSASADGAIRSWDVAAAAFRRVELDHGFGVNVIALDDEAGWLAYGGVDGAVKVIDIESGAPIADFTSERQPVLAMAYHKAAQRLVVGDGEGHIHIIDTQEWATQRDFRAAPKGPVWAMAFDAEGARVYAGTLANHIDIWPIETATGVAEADAPFREFHRAPETMSNGERQFMRKCSVCHTLTPDGGRRAGPSLHRIFGRSAGTLPGYAYSPALEGADLIWNFKTLDKLFDLGPAHYTPGSKMPMQRIVRASDRTDLIDYLKEASVKTEPEGDETQ